MLKHLFFAVILAAAYYSSVPASKPAVTTQTALSDCAGCLEACATERSVCVQQAEVDLAFCYAEAEIRYVECRAIAEAQIASCSQPGGSPECLQVGYMMLAQCDNALDLDRNFCQSQVYGSLVQACDNQKNICEGICRNQYPNCP